VLTAAGVNPIMLPAKSPNLNAYAERWVRSVKHECLSKLVLFGEGPLQRSLTEYAAHYHLERNHQGKGNKLLTPLVDQKGLKIHCHQRLGCLLKFYARAA
jgi:transposase InsO family protein